VALRACILVTLFDSLLLVSLLFGLDSAPNAAAIARQATALYRAKRYEAACPLFRQVTELAPARGAAWGDYGLCLARLGRNQEALEATYRAITLSGSDSKSRNAAYHNLGKVLGHTFPSHVPGPTEEGPLAELEGMLPRCEIFDPVPTCDRRAWGCFWGLGGGIELARFARDPRSIAAKSWPQANSGYDAIRVVLDGDVLVMTDEATEATRAGPTACRFSVACRVVWADACAGRVGYSCDVAIGLSPGEAWPDGVEDVPCSNRSTRTGELKLP
jgi:hypothetical protein